jgi:3'-phosphoadenosine 5'-phosphosulfate synthase
MAIWPAPMVYAGPTEVQFHAKSRRSAGASYFVVGRDPAGMKGSMDALAHPDDDLYDGDHGRYVLQNSPGIGSMQMLSFVKVMYDIKDDTMKVPDSTRMEDFVSISGTKMRLLASNGAHLCSPQNIPIDLISANCIPSGFMVPEGWDIVVDYYKNEKALDKWIPWSQPIVNTTIDKITRSQGVFGRASYQLVHQDYKSIWHDIPMGLSDNMVTFVVEIPMFISAKMEMQKDVKGNYISQDSNGDGSPRFYTYGTPFFNYGFIPQTWEDPSVVSSDGHRGDNDPLDVMEIGSSPLPMGSINQCRILGSFSLIDEGETDYKIICITKSDPDFVKIHNMDDLEKMKPGTLIRLVDWLKRYKTSDGKPENKLSSEIPSSVQEATEIIRETHRRWAQLCGDQIENSWGLWLDSPSCKAHRDSDDSSRR